MEPIVLFLNILCDKAKVNKVYSIKENHINLYYYNHSCKFKLLETIFLFQHLKCKILKTNYLSEDADFLYFLN